MIVEAIMWEAFWTAVAITFVGGPIIFTYLLIAAFLIIELFPKRK